MYLSLLSKGYENLIMEECHAMAILAQQIDVDRNLILEIPTIGLPASNYILR
jgi:hypothetical protein